MEEYLLYKYEELKKKLNNNLELYMKLIAEAKKKYDKKYLMNIKNDIVRSYETLEEIKKAISEKDYNKAIDTLVTVSTLSDQQKEKLNCFKSNEYASDKQATFIVYLLNKDDKYALKDNVCIETLTKNQAMTIIRALKGEIGYDDSVKKLLISKVPPIALTDEEKSTMYHDIINHLNEKANRHYKDTTNSTRKLIDDRLSEGFTKDDFIKAIDNKVEDWLGTDYEKYLRPETLFGKNFAKYLKASNNKIGGDRV